MLISQVSYNEARRVRRRRDALSTLCADEPRARASLYAPPLFARGYLLDSDNATGLFCCSGIAVVLLSYRIIATT